MRNIANVTKRYLCQNRVVGFVITKPIRNASELANLIDQEVPTMSTKRRPGNKKLPKPNSTMMDHKIEADCDSDDAIETEDESELNHSSKRVFTRELPPSNPYMLIPDAIKLYGNIQECIISYRIKDRDLRKYLYEMHLGGMYYVLKLKTKDILPKKIKEERRFIKHLAELSGIHKSTIYRYSTLGRMEAELQLEHGTVSANALLALSSGTDFKSRRIIYQKAKSLIHYNAKNQFPTRKNIMAAKMSYQYDLKSMEEREAAIAEAELDKYLNDLDDEEIDDACISTVTKLSIEILNKYSSLSQLTILRKLINLIKSKTKIVSKTKVGQDALQVINKLNDDERSEFIKELDAQYNNICNGLN